MGHKKKDWIKVCLFVIDPCSHEVMSSISKSLIISIASKDLGVSTKSIVIKRDLNGKPYIVGYDNWHFNITHTDGMIGIVISDKPVGIDVELVRDIDLLIAKRFFTVNENFNIERAPNKHKTFFEIWTKKEAYLKFSGRGLRVSLKSFNVYELTHCIKTFEVNEYIISVCRENIHHLAMLIEYFVLHQSK